MSSTSCHHFEKSGFPGASCKQAAACQTHLETGKPCDEAGLTSQASMKHMNIGTDTAWMSRLSPQLQPHWLLRISKTHISCMQRLASAEQLHIDEGSEELMVPLLLLIDGLAWPLLTRCAPHSMEYFAGTAQTPRLTP